MIGKALLSLTLLTMCSLLAQTDLATCQSEFELYGEKAISPNCSTLLRESASGNNKKKIGDYDVEATDTAIFVTKNSITQIQAGGQTKMNRPMAIAYNEDLLASLSADGEIYLYHGQIMGNVAPIKIMKDKRYYGASDIAFGEESLGVLNLKEGKLLVIDMQKSLKIKGSEIGGRISKELQLPEKSVFSITYNKEKKCFDLLVNPESPESIQCL